MKKPRIIALTLVLALACTLVPFASAAPVQSGIETIQPLWVNVNNVTLTLSYSGNAATCSGKIDALSGTTSISATFTLSLKNANGTYSPLKTWSTIYASGQRLIWSDTYSTVAAGDTYRLSVSAQVHRNSVNEPISTWVEVKY